MFHGIETHAPGQESELTPSQGSHTLIQQPMGRQPARQKAEFGAPVQLDRAPYPEEPIRCSVNDWIQDLPLLPQLFFPEIDRMLTDLRSSCELRFVIH